MILKDESKNITGYFVLKCKNDFECVAYFPQRAYCKIRAMLVAREECNLTIKVLVFTFP